MVYVVYCEVYDSRYDYPTNDLYVVGICSSKDIASNMMEEYGKSIEERCNKFGDKYVKSIVDDGKGLMYDLSDTFGDNTETIYYKETELNKIITRM